MNTARRLYRSRTDRQLAGVCGGIADYLNLDPTIVRVIWAILTLAGGPGLILYIILSLVVPEEPEFVQTSAEKIKNDDYI